MATTKGLPDQIPTQNAPVLYDEGSGELRFEPHWYLFLYRMWKEFISNQNAAVLANDILLQDPSTGGVGGGVTSFSFVNANGFTGTVANATTTPALTLLTAPGLTNPMTTAGDLIDGGVAGAPQRLGIGSTGQVLTVVSGAPAWAASAADPDGYLALTDGATVAINVSAANHFSWTVTGQRHVLQAATGIPSSNTRVIYLRVKQDGTGGWTPQFDASYLFPRGVALVNLAANAETLIVLEYQANDATWIQINGTPTPIYQSTVNANASFISVGMHLQGPNAADDGPLNLTPLSGPSGGFAPVPYAGIPNPPTLYNLGYGLFTGAGVAGIKFAPGAPFNMGSGDFTMEMWVSFTAAGISGRCILCGQCTAAGANLTFNITKGTSGALSCTTIIGGVTQSLTGSGTQFTAGLWYHVALCRVGNTVRLFLNGISQGGSNTVSGAFATNAVNNFSFGSNGDQTVVVGGAYGTCLLGQMYDAFLWKGLGKYSGNFTPPLGQLQDH